MKEFSDILFKIKSENGDNNGIEILIFNNSLKEYLHKTQIPLFSPLTNIDRLILNLKYRKSDQSLSESERLKHYVGAFGYTPIFFTFDPAKSDIFEVYLKKTLFTLTEKKINEYKITDFT